MMKDVFFQKKNSNFALAMNWKFILSWGIKFALCVVVWDLALAFTQRVWLASALALGVLILLAIAESYVIDWMEKRRNKE